MARKIGDFAIGVIFLGFMITAMSAMFVGFDSNLGLNGSYINNSLIASTSTVGSDDLEENFVFSTDSISSTDIAGTELEVRGAGTPGLLSGTSKNTVIAFFSHLQTKFPIISPIIFGFIVSLSLITLTILFVRFFWGESKG